MIVPCIGCGAHVHCDGTIPMSVDDNDNPCDFVCLGCVSKLGRELDEEEMK